MRTSHWGTCPALAAPDGRHPLCAKPNPSGCRLVSWRPVALSLASSHPPSLPHLPSLPAVPLRHRRRDPRSAVCATTRACKPSKLTLLQQARGRAGRGRGAVRRRCRSGGSDGYKGCGGIFSGHGLCAGCVATRGRQMCGLLLRGRIGMRSVGSGCTLTVPCWTAQGKTGIQGFRLQRATLVSSSASQGPRLPSRRCSDETKLLSFF